MIEIYYPDYDPNDEDDDVMLGIKTTVQSLRPVERKIFLTYVEGGTYTSVAKEFNVSTPTAKKYINEIITKIRKKCNDNNCFNAADIRYSVSGV